MATTLIPASKILLLIKALGPGEHWLTVHPPGHDKGHPILVQDQPDGTVKVIGGAGGKLNHLRFTPRAKSETAKQAAQERRQAKKERKQEQVKADKAAGAHEAKKQAKTKLAEKRKSAEREFIKTVAEHMGWKPEALEFPAQDYQHLSDKAQSKLAGEHHRELLKRAKKVAGQQREWLVADPAARQAASLGEIPIESADPEQLSVQDLDPVRAGGESLGFSADYAERAEASPEEIKQEAQQAKLEGMTEAEREATMKRGGGASLIQQELEGVKRPDAPKVTAKLDDAKKAAAILSAQKKLSSLSKQIAEMGKQVDAGEAPRVADLAVAGDAKIAADVAKSIEDDLKTLSVRNFNEQINEGGGREVMAKHVGVGAHNALNAVALAVGGEALLDRSVVDVIGIDGAAAVLARRLRSGLTPDDMEHVTKSVEEFHKTTHADSANAAIKQAEEAMSALADLDVSAAVTLEEASAINAHRKDAIEAARTALGTTLGELEANAALVSELSGRGRDSLSIPMGKQSLEACIQQARAIGLQRGDYSVSRENGETRLYVTAGGMDKIASPIDRAGFMQVQRNLALMRGDHDEEGWLPLGFANRRDMATDIKPGVAPSLAEPFQPGPDLKQSIKDYIGGRAADGDSPADILADVQSADFFAKAGDDAGYRAALDEVAPLVGEGGKQNRAEDLADSFNKYADDFVQSRHGGERAPINRQEIKADEHSVEALHRALSTHPEGVVAFKQVGELDHADQRALRETFFKDVAKESPDAAADRQELEKHEANEPEKTVTDMFGDETANPDHDAWRTKRDELRQKIGESSLDWNKYVDAMGGRPAAYQAVQDLIKSKVEKEFADHHNRLRPKEPIKVGRQTIRGNLDHLDAVDPKASAARAAKEKALIDSLRERQGGRYAAGAVSDKLSAAREQQAAFEQAQMGFFSTEDMFGDGDAKQEKPLGADERHTLGHVAERQLAGLMSQVGKNFKPGQPTKLWNVSMSGKYAAQQRAVKMIAENKRVGLAFSAGSGKTGIMLGAHSHLSGLGKVKRSLMLVPSVVQGQFHGEALRYLEPGKFNWHAQPGASRAERIAAYKNPEHDFVVQTHQSFRDDMVYLGAKHAGVSTKEMTASLAGMDPAARKDWIAGVMEKEGISFDASMVDEAHETVTRAGKPASTLAHVTDALTDNTPYYVYASGDPVKNDVSEAADVMAKMDRSRYGDKAAWMRRYGVNTKASGESMKREMARHIYSQSITPDISRARKTERVDLSPGQQKAMDELDGHFASARLARMRGEVDLKAVKAISPGSFEGVPKEQHEEVAKQIQKSLGIMRSSAKRRIINDHPDNAKVNRIAELAAERKGKQGVVFAHSRAAVEQIKSRLEAEGHRVVTITGSDSASDKDAKRKLFNPESGDAKADIMVASDAAAVGMNLQSGSWLVQHDTPDTAKTHGQRNARIDRIGQQNAVELIDMVANHPEEDRARSRLARKHDLRDLMLSPMESLDDTGVAHFLNRRSVVTSQ